MPTKDWRSEVGLAGGAGMPLSPQPSPTEAAHGRYEPTGSSKDDYWSAFKKELLRTGGEAALGVLKSPFDLIKNTVSTGARALAFPLGSPDNPATEMGEGIVNALSHPIQTLRDIGNNPREVASFGAQMALAPKAPELAKAAVPKVASGMIRAGEALEGAGNATGSIPLWKRSLAYPLLKMTPLPEAVVDTLEAGSMAGPPALRGTGRMLQKGGKRLQGLQGAAGEIEHHLPNISNGTQGFGPAAEPIRPSVDPHMPNAASSEPPTYGPPANVPNRPWGSGVRAAEEAVVEHHMPNTGADTPTYAPGASTVRGLEDAVDHYMPNVSSIETPAEPAPTPSGDSALPEAWRNLPTADDAAAEITHRNVTGDWDPLSNTPGGASRLRKWIETGERRFGDTATLEPPAAPSDLPTTARGVVNDARLRGLFDARDLQAGGMRTNRSLSGLHEPIPGMNINEIPADLQAFKDAPEGVTHDFPEEDFMEQVRRVGAGNQPKPVSTPSDELPTLDLFRRITARAK